MQLESKKKQSRLRGWLLVASLLCLAIQVKGQTPLVDYVNPFIGTSNYGATYPGAVVPHGMVSVVPFNVTGSKLNTFDKDKQWLSTPYVYENKYFTGFTHVNLSGVGCPELGVILVSPTMGELDADVHHYGSTYSKEEAHPGYYSVHLNKYNMDAEVTATTRSGLSKYTFPAGKANILINLGVSLTNETGGMLKVVNDHEVEGYRMTGGFCYNDETERPVYFVARFSRKGDDFGVWKKMPDMPVEGQWSATNNQYKYYPKYSAGIAGDSIGAYMQYDLKESTEIFVQVGVSYVSIENARMNLDKEQQGFDFEQTRAEAVRQWEKALHKIEVEGGSKEDKVNFYSALYHVLIHPNILNDVDGAYPVMGGYDIARTKSGEDHYTVFSLWDTYRNVHPLLTLAYPKEQLDMARSLVQKYRESGWLPKWELNNTETHVMEGDPVIPVFADMYVKGLRDFDVETAYEGMKKSATLTGAENFIRPDLDDYLTYGYLPLRSQYDNSVSQALEYYVADWNLAQLAFALDKKEDGNAFLKRSKQWTSYYDKEYNVLRPKLDDGKFITPFDPRQGENFEPVPGFHEGTAWQYTFGVPHDVKGLIRTFGGKKQFINTLQSIFDDELFDMANEPDINYPYLFSYVKGEEWRTQERVTALREAYFKNEAGGLPGNDDTGTLSAWLVFSMMGIYPVCPGNPEYVITTPAFDKVTLHLSKAYYSGNTFVIEKNGMGNFIQSMQLNGNKYASYFISHDDIVKGGALQLNVSKEK